jgi:tetratricopeptide (TPR) repeat protein
MFEESSESYKKAVVFYLARGKTSEAIRVYRYKQDYYLAGQLNESLNNLKDAARDYYEGKHYKDAMRAFKNNGDEVGMARVYERTKEFDKALEIWKKKGRKRDYDRVLTKKAKKSMSERQLKLLKPDKTI